MISLGEHGIDLMPLATKLILALVFLTEIQLIFYELRPLHGYFIYEFVALLWLLTHHKLQYLDVTS